MPHFLTYILNGLNINEANALARTGDVRHFGNIIRNSTVAGIIEQDRASRVLTASLDAILHESAMERIVDGRIPSRSISFDEQRHLDRITAVHLSNLRRQQESNDDVESDDAVEDYIRHW